MSSADTPPFSESSNDEAPPKHAVPATQSLASFAVLADPASIAGAPVVEPAKSTASADESNAIIDRLRSELQRRARQIETLSRDGSVRPAPIVETRDPIQPAEPGWKPVGTPSAVSPSEARPQVGAESTPTADRSDSGLRRLLQAAHQARRELQERLATRENQLETSRRAENQLREKLEGLRAELELQSRERNRLQELESGLDARGADFETIREECNSLRSALAEAQRGAAEARKAAARSREVLSETRTRVMAADAEASALRGALATNQQQTRARECENAELQAALSIASETLETRRAQLRHARTELEATTCELQRSERRAVEFEAEVNAEAERAKQRDAEIAALNARVPRLEQELATSRSALEPLRAQLARSEGQLVDLREALDQTQLQRDALQEELASERQAVAEEREQAREREAMLSQLRETLASISKAASSLPMLATPPRKELVGEVPAVETAPAAEFEPRNRDEVVETIGAAPSDAEPTFDDALLSSGATEPGFETASAADDESFAAPCEGGELESLIALLPPRCEIEPPAVFRMWRDGQLAKKLAPLGVASADEFFASRIEPLFELATDTGIDILSLGARDSEFELRIARNLRSRGRDGFRIHFPQASPEHAEQILAKASRAGLDQELVPFAREAVAPEIGSLHFHAIVSDGGISDSADPESLVLALARAAKSGTLLAVAERIGRGGSRTAREMGDRIWQLMPERYKRNPISKETEPHYWRDDFDELQESDLLALLRSHFAFEDFASFGHLVDRFVGPEIGPNFDPNDDRDRRFIEQIANLDDAKLDTGALSPLHMIARLTARDPVTH